uniref:Uncharacterized protein n=1 Tax=Anguilla anguilla TaxID=7936 RepID=A0A0E9PJJ7_ANGAN
MCTKLLENNKNCF